jgi:signal transduction histidine kinase
LASNLSTVTGHKGQLREVITNLIQNAIEAMDAVGGRRALTVKTELDADDAPAIVIQDNGPGLIEGKAVFEPFVTTKSHSMGLGLAICRLIVERHSGTLSVSQANPRGAIFRIVLPRTQS